MLKGFFDRKASVKLAWQQQIEDAQNYKGKYEGTSTLDQELANDLREALQKPDADFAALGGHFASWMKGGGDLHSHFLPMLFDFLAVCTTKHTPASYLESLAETLHPKVREGPQPRKDGTHLAGALAFAMAQVIRAGNERSDMVKALEVVRDDAKWMSNTVPVFEGANELFDLADRVHDLLSKLQAGSNAPVRSSSIAEAQSNIASLRVARAWLRPFTASPARRLDYALHPAGLTFFTQKFRERFKNEFGSQNAQGANSFEAVIFNAILDAYEVRCKAAHQKAAGSLALKGKAENMECSITNYTGKPLVNVVLNVTVAGKNVEPSPKAQTIEPFSATTLDLVADQAGKGELTVSLMANDSSEKLVTVTCAFPPAFSDARMEQVHDHLPHRFVRYQSTYETLKDPLSSGLISYPWWDTLDRSLQEGGGNIKVLYGIPRVGKTTGLLGLRKRRIADLQKSLCGVGSAGQSILFPLYLNLEAQQLTADYKMALRLLADDVMDELEEVAEEMLVHFEDSQKAESQKCAGEAIEKCTNLQKELKGARKRLEEDADGNKGNITAEILRRYFSSIDRALRDAHGDWRLFLILDEWSAFWKASPEVARRLHEFFGILARRDAGMKIVQCSAGLVDMQLASDYSIGRTRNTQYPGAAETDFKFIAAEPFDREGMIEVLQGWLYKAEEADRVCDDLAAVMIHEYTGGHALLINVLGKYLQDGIRAKQLQLPITYEDAHRICAQTLPDVRADEPWLRNLRAEMRDALVTIWTGLAGSGLGTNDLPKLRAVLEGESWADLQDMIECGLISMSSTDLAPRLRIQGLESFYQEWRDNI